MFVTKHMSTRCQPLRCCLQYISRTATIVNTVDPWSFTETTTPVPNQDLDGQLIMPCASDPSGQCSVLMDTIIVLPGSTTRIAFFGPPVAGLHVWHWYVARSSLCSPRSYLCMLMTPWESTQNSQTGPLSKAHLRCSSLLEVCRFIGQARV